MREPLVITPVENYVFFKKKKIICILVLATEMAGIIPGSRIGAKIRASNG
jgi:hypothetical protein